MDKLVSAARRKEGTRVYDGPMVDAHVHLQLDDDSRMAGRTHPLVDYWDTLRLGFSPSEQRQIAHDNAAALFALDG